jgi:DNA adenine methylase
MDLLRAIIQEPEHMARQYDQVWSAQLTDPRGYYDTIRDEFNRTQRPELLLYILARCVKASVRYNSNGDFNQSPDNRRLGRRPHSMRQEIFGVSALLRGRTAISSGDYRQILDWVDPHADLIYMDPPYQGTSSGRDNRYVQGLPPEEFVTWLAQLNRQQSMYLVSYDGRRGETVYGDPLPESLGLYRVEINAGRSTQSTLLGREDVTTESLYLSSALVSRLKSEGRWRQLSRVNHELQSMAQLGLGLP